MVRGLNVGPFECLIVLFIVAALLAVVLLAVFLLTRANRGVRENPARLPETSLDVLRRRLAAGEITVEQFDELRRRLES